MKRVRLQNLPPEVGEDIRKVATILRRYGATRIVLYGSFARGDYRHDSDIDIGVEGVPSENYFRAVAECLLAARRSVTPVPIENTEGALRSRILQEGKIVYERRQTP